MMTRRVLIAVGYIGLLLAPRVTVAQPPQPPAAAAPTAAKPDEARVKLSLQLLELTDVRKQMETAMSAVMNAQLGPMMDSMRRAGVSEAEIARREAMQKELPALILQEMQWDNVAQDAAMVQASVFTEDELRAMIAFYQSPPAAPGSSARRR